MLIRKRGRIWVVEAEKEPKKSADRPHWTTILSTFLGSALSIAAFFMSVQSFKIASNTLEVTKTTTQLLNRAYVVVEKEELTFDHGEPHNGVTASDWVLTLKYNLTNLGNTPAFIKEATFTIHNPAFLGGGTNEIRRHLGYIAAKTTIPQVHTLGIYEGPLDTRSKRLGFRVNGLIMAEDIFYISTAISRCWGVGVNGNPVDCKDVLFKE